jgi:glycosyltransferase involved in cell wall biosynthesis
VKSTTAAPLRLALVTRRYPPAIGGAEKMLSYLARALADEGCHVTVLTSRIDPASPVVEHQPATPGSLVVRRLETLGLRFAGTLRYMFHLRRALHALQPDLAYVSMLKHDAFVALGVAQRDGFPIVLRPEGAGPTGDIAWHTWGRFGRRIAQRCRQADAFVAISDAVHAELVAAGFDSDRIIRIANGVPIPEDAWHLRPEWSRAPRATFIGRLAREKNLGTLIDAWPQVRAAFPSATLTLIGEGPERAVLQARISELGLQDAITLPGPSHLTQEHLRSCDFFLLPSTEEGMSISLLEAMALGMPIVASDIPGNRQLITSGVHGCLAPPDSPQAFASAILDQWQNLDRAIIMAHAARSRAHEFSISNSARAHLELFRSLIARKHTHS